MSFRFLILKLKESSSFLASEFVVSHCYVHAGAVNFNPCDLRFALAKGQVVIFPFIPQNGIDLPVEKSYNCHILQERVTIRSPRLSPF